MRAHIKRGYSKISIEPIRYYGGEIKSPRAYIADWLQGAACLRRAGMFESARQSLQMTRRYRQEQGI